MEKGKWCYSYNEENFEGDFDTKEQAIEEAMYYYKDYELDQDYIWVGQTKPVSVGVNTDSILEQLGEEAYEQAGEYADDYLSNVTLNHMKILEQRLNDVLGSWMKEFNYEPNFWAVENIQKVDVSNYLKTSYEK
jgi:hypothetical protein